MSDQNEIAVGLDDDLLLEVVLVSAVDRTVYEFEKKRAGRKPFAAPDAVRAAHEIALRANEATSE